MKCGNAAVLHPLCLENISCDYEHPIFDCVNDLTIAESKLSDIYFTEYEEEYNYGEGAGQGRTTPLQGFANTLFKLAPLERVHVRHVRTVF
jgi:hypothetical protein